MYSVKSIQILFNKIKLQIINKDNLSAIQLIDMYIDDKNKEFDMLYLTQEDIDLIENCLFISVIMLLNCLPFEALETINPIRKILDRIYSKNLWMSMRLLKNNKDDLGYLYELPDLVKFEIHKIILNSF